MRYSICARCAAVLPRKVSSCPSCGMSIGLEKKRQIKLCKRDGTPVPVDGHFCTTCGLRVRGWYVPIWLWLSIAAIIGLGVTGLLNSLHQSILKTYRPETCVITDASVTSYSDKSGTHYEPDFTYQVIQSDQQIIAGGDGSMGLGSFSDVDEAQQAVDSYSLNVPHLCWYSPLGDPTALLISPEATDSGVGYMFIWFCGTVLLLYLVDRCLVHLFLYPWGLYHRMVRATGTVLRHEQYNTKQGRRTLSIIQYRTTTEPALLCQKKQYAELPLNSSIQVCYDWRYPSQNARFLPAYSQTKMTTAMLGGVALLLVVLALASTLFIALAFNFS